jgi:hypothetical protein
MRFLSWAGCMRVGRIKPRTVRYSSRASLALIQASSATRTSSLCCSTADVMSCLTAASTRCTAAGFCVLSVLVAKTAILASCRSALGRQPTWPTSSNQLLECALDRLPVGAQQAPQSQVMAA